MCYRVGRMSEADRESLCQRPIAVFDSGLGGLTVVRELTRAMPGEDILYLGDTARVPYGIKSLETVRRFAREDARFLLARDPKLLVVACNTASAAGTDHLEALSPVEVIDVIRPGAAAALEATRGRIGVIGTEATIASGAYQRALEAADPAREVMAVACPLLVPIVEEGRREDDPIVLHVLSDYLRGLQRFLGTGEAVAGGTDRSASAALILGCTHYPLLAGAIGKLMGPHVPLVSSAAATAKKIEHRLRSNGLRSARESGGTLGCYTTDNAERFAALGERFGGRKIDHVEYVGTDELESPATEPAEAMAE